MPEAENMYLLTHSLSPVLVLVAVMDPKELKTKISHTHSLILSPVEPSGSSPTVTRTLEIHTYGHCMERSTLRLPFPFE